MTEIFENVSMEDRSYPQTIDGFEPYDFETVDVDWWYEFYYYWMNYFAAALILTFFIVICCVKQFMKNRPPYNLKTQFTLWNIFFATFYLCALVRVTPEFLSIWKNPNPIHRALCNK